MTHPLSVARTPLRPGAARRAHRLRRASALLTLGAALGAGALGCSNTDQVATTPSTTAAPATSAPAADASGAPRGTGSTVATTPGTMAITTSTTTPGASTTVTTGSGPLTSSTRMVTVAPTIPQEPSSTVAGSAADAAFCAKGAQIEAQLSSIDPTNDPAGALAQYKQVFTELTAAAPPEVQADMNQINAVIQSMTSFDSPPPDAEKLEAAGQRVDTWAVAHCGKKFGG